MPSWRPPSRRRAASAASVPAPWATPRWRPRSPPCAQATDKPFARRPPHRHARRHGGAGADHHRGRRHRLRGGARRADRGDRAVPPRRRARRQHVRQGRPRRARRRGRLRPRRGPGHRGGRPHRPGGDHAARPPDRRRRGRPRPGRGGRWHLRRARPRRRALPRRRRHLGRHPLHRDARGAQRPRLQGHAAGQPGGPDHGQPRLLGQDDARRAQRVHRTTTTATPRS